MTFDEIINNRRVIITSGTGGVGKTTLSAALGLRAAILGKKVLVITIDPAKRLVTSLGLNELGHQITEITEKLSETLQDEGSPWKGQEVKGKIWATMPDTRKTFDQFMHSLSPSPETIEKVLNNPVYQVVATEFSGANEYMSLHVLDAAILDPKYDLIILDTPPNRNTLAFLDASRLLSRLFEDRLIRWLVTPTNKILSIGVKKLLGLMESLTGEGFIRHLLDFAAALFEVQGPFREKLARISNIMKSDQVGFLLVTSPTPDTVPELMHLIGILKKRKFNFDGIILNRTLEHLKPPTAKDKFGEQAHHASDILERMIKREESVTVHLTNRLRNDPNLNKDLMMVQIPELSRDVHNLADLSQIASTFAD